MSSYKGKLRLRSCGLLVKGNSILLVQLLSPITKELIWMPPGGGLEFGETLEETLKREVREETGLHVKAKSLMHVNEVIKDQFHAIEFFYNVEYLSGKLQTGTDPELSESSQIIKDVAFKNKNELRDLKVVPDYLKEEFWTDYESSL
ncbi:MAG: NUDIX hydrolase [Balneola sp.]